jgi:hypothetical protein
MLHQRQQQHLNAIIKQLNEHILILRQFVALLQSFRLFFIKYMELRQVFSDVQ